MSTAPAAAPPVMKDCPVGLCGTRIVRELVMCSLHWSRVPEGLRQQVRAAARGSRGVGSSAHGAAVQAAVRYLNERAFS